MARYLKRWESPRREGRNHKGKGGSARQRQIRKQFQTLRKKLKDSDPQPPTHPNSPSKPKGGIMASLFAGDTLLAGLFKSEVDLFSRSSALANWAGMLEGVAHTETIDVVDPAHCCGVAAATNANQH